MIKINYGLNLGNVGVLFTKCLLDTRECEKKILSFNKDLNNA
jgi:hypothetical protein